MAKKPTAIEIRSYQVGFGDCFLVSFVYSPKERRHVLIDFGTTGLPDRKKPSTHMPQVAKAIKDVCGKSGLTAVVATHRHADHISGFATDGKTGKSGVVIRELRPKLVLQPWTEDPAAAKKAMSATTAKPATPPKRGGASLVSALVSMNDLADRVQRLAEAKPAWMSATMQRQLSFLGAENIANRSAIDNLIAMGTAKDAKAKYLRHGDDSGLERLLPGVKVHVLGPPDLTQTKGTMKQKSSDPNEFWQLVANAVPGAAGARAVIAGPNGRSHGQSTVPPDARWFRDKLQAVNGQSLLEIVRQLDAQMNNTSVILLFEVAGKKLLFPGDAQIENWSYALIDAPDAEKTAKLLEEVDFYKVGHHGSRNATPRKLLWERFHKRKGRQLKTMISTMPGKHGNKRSKTEVPRETLLTALETQSQLKNTDDLPKDGLFNLEVFPI